MFHLRHPAGITTQFFRYSFLQVVRRMYDCSLKEETSSTSTRSTKIKVRAVILKKTFKEANTISNSNAALYTYKVMVKIGSNVNTSAKPNWIWSLLSIHACLIVILFAAPRLFDTGDIMGDVLFGLEDLILIGGALCITSILTLILTIKWWDDLTCGTRIMGFQPILSTFLIVSAEELLL